MPSLLFGQPSGYGYRRPFSMSYFAQPPFAGSPGPSPDSEEPGLADLYGFRTDLFPEFKTRLSEEELTEPTEDETAFRPKPISEKQLRDETEEAGDQTTGPTTPPVVRSRAGASTSTIPSRLRGVRPGTSIETPEESEIIQKLKLLKTGVKTADTAQKLLRAILSDQVDPETIAILRDYSDLFSSTTPPTTNEFLDIIASEAGMPGLFTGGVFEEQPLSEAGAEALADYLSGNTDQLPAVSELFGDSGVTGFPGFSSSLMTGGELLPNLTTSGLFEGTQLSERAMEDIASQLFGGTSTGAASGATAAGETAAGAGASSLVDSGTAGFGLGSLGGSALGAGVGMGLNLLGIDPRISNMLGSLTTAFAGAGPVGLAGIYVAALFDLASKLLGGRDYGAERSAERAETAAQTYRTTMDLLKSARDPGTLLSVLRAPVIGSLPSGYLDPTFYHTVPTIGGLLATMAMEQAGGNYNREPFGWAPDPRYSSLYQGLASLGFTPEQYNIGRVNSVGELVAALGGRNNAPGGVRAWSTILDPLATLFGGLTPDILSQWMAQYGQVAPARTIDQLIADARERALYAGLSPEQIQAIKEGRALFEYDSEGNRRVVGRPLYTDVEGNVIRERLPWEEALNYMSTASA